MIQLTRPVLIAAVAGVVAICAIAVAAWRLYAAGESPLAPAVATRAAPESASIAPPVSAPVVPASPPVSGPTPATPPSRPGEASAPQPAATKLPVEVAKPAADAAKPPADMAKPSFDVVRIEPTGEAVVAGRAEPRAQVALTLAGKPLAQAQAQADADGQFVMLPPKLPPGDHVLGLRATGPTGETTSEQTVAIAVPARGEREAVATLTAPDKPTVILSQPGGSVAASAQVQDLRITSIEAQQGGAFFASGVAPAGAALRLYLNEAYVASVEAGPDGKWSIRIERGMSPGAYRVRADRVGEDGRATARVEAPFDYPAQLARQVAAATPAAAPSSQASALAPAGQGGAPGAAAPAAVSGGAGPSAAPPQAAPPASAQPAAARSGDAQNAVVEELRTARVERGDSLWRISVSIYGQGVRYTQIYDANASQIRNPDLIYPGQVLVVPKKDEQKPAGERQR